MNASDSPTTETHSGDTHSLSPNETPQTLPTPSEGAEVITGTLQMSFVDEMPVEENLSLPAALCDDLLLHEIRSIPNKMGFKIGEVAEMLGIKQYVLRYWETEFEVLKPKKAMNKQRYYTKRDVENAYLIRKLLHRDRFSIEGARSALKSLKDHVKRENKKTGQENDIKSELAHCQEQLALLRMEMNRMKRLFA